MENINKSYQLSSGHSMPCVGLGTYMLEKSQEISQAIIENGYRHLDCASYYQNEEIVGEGIRESIRSGKVKREDLFIVTKVWPSEVGDIEQALDNSLSRLGLEYVDLYLLHWPLAVTQQHDQVHFMSMPLHCKWPVMESLVINGKAKSIGLSNHNVQIIIDLLCYAKIKPVCNQIELHPFCSQTDMVDFLKDNDIVPVAFYPIIRKKQKETFEHPLLVELSRKHNKSVSQILLRWGLQRGHAVIPKSSNLQRQNENINIFDFQLSEEDMQQLSTLDVNERGANKYPFMKGYNIFA